MKWKRIRKVLKGTGRVLACQFVGVAMSAFCSGCATTGYLGDRMRDAGDVFTASVGMGAGAKARVGPLQVGAIGNIDMWGLRGGKLGDVAFYETLTSDFLSPWPIKGKFGEERYVYGAPREMPNKRGKGFLAKAPLPVVGVADQPEYYTQVEVVVAIIGSVRLGFNPGELLDFILGWTTLDIYKDDMTDTEVNKPSEATR